MEEKKITCILCPRGCEMSVQTKENMVIKVEGNACSKGKDYAIEEIVAPKRVITSTVKIISGKKKMLPVKSDRPVLKKDIVKLLDIIYETEVKAPIKMGQVIIKNIGDTDVDIVATAEDKG